MTGQVIVVEDDAPVREALAQTLELAGISVIPAGSFIVAKDHIAAGFPGVILTDIRMPGKDGMHLLDHAHKTDPDLPVILLTGEGDIPTAVSAMTRGAFDFLEKPCPTEMLVATVERALTARRLVMENRRLQAALTAGDAAARLIFGASELADRLRTEIRQIARLEGPVMIEGAPGSGLPKVAEVLHLLSPRASGAFVKLGAAGLKQGTLTEQAQVAEGGTLFLNEIALLPEELQFTLVEMIDRESDTRLLAGTTRDLRALADSGGFNAELYYRLEALRVRIPALKERPEDIPVLFRHYVVQACEQAGVPERPIPPALLAQIMSQDWPGNARALMNAAMRFALGLDADGSDEEIGLAEKMAQIEAQLLIDALRRHGGNASATAEALKLPRKTAYDKFAKYGIRPEDYR